MKKVLGLVITLIAIVVMAIVVACTQYPPAPIGPPPADAALLSCDVVCANVQKLQGDFQGCKDTCALLANRNDQYSFFQCINGATSLAQMDGCDNAPVSAHALDIVRGH